MERGDQERLFRGQVSLDLRMRVRWPARGRFGDMGVGTARAKALRREGAWHMLRIKDNQDSRGYS